jgi:transcriptional regulator with XRE-family HTH domain
MKVNREFCKRLKKLRFDSELNQSQTAKILDVTQQTYSRYETGFIEPDMNTLEKMALMFDVSLDYLFGLSNEIISPRKPLRQHSGGDEITATIHNGTGNKIHIK